MKLFRQEMRAILSDCKLPTQQESFQKSYGLPKTVVCQSGHVEAGNEASDDPLYNFEIACIF